MGGIESTRNLERRGSAVDKDLVRGPVQAVDDQDGNQVPVVLIKFPDLLSDLLQPETDFPFLAVDIPGDGRVSALDLADLVENGQGHVRYVVRLLSSPS